jgi:glycosyltransferase involved in cell wall biosynthesis
LKNTLITPQELEKRIVDSYELPNRVLETIPEPMVTVRTSTYQHAAYIRECIEGVLMQQTTFPFEYIIGEDFSTDGTREIVFEYAKKYPDKIRVITAGYNVGMKANGRRCTRASRGKYIALCEGDDYWTDPLKLQRQVDFLEENQEYVMCCHACKIIFENDPAKTDFSFISDKDETLTLDEFLNPDSKNRIRTESVVYKNGFIKDYPAWTQQLMVGDFPLFLLLAYTGKIRYLHRIMSVYRIHSGGVWSSKQNSNDYLEKYYVNTVDMYRYFDEYSEFRFHDKIKKIISHRFYKLIRNVKGDLPTRRKYYIKYILKLTARKKLEFFILLYLKPLRLWWSKLVMEGCKRLSYHGIRK